MENSPFNKLPAELRINIYEYALTMRNGIKLSRIHNEYTKRHDVKVNTAWARAHLKFLSTCKQIRQEALPIFFSCNPVRIDTTILGSWSQRETEEAKWEAFNLLKAWLPSLGSNITYIRSIILDISPWHAFDKRDDHFITFLPMALKDLATLLPSRQAKVSVHLHTLWNRSYGEGSVVGVASRVSLGDNREGRAAFSGALQDADKMVERTLRAGGLHQGITWHDLKADLHRARRNIDQLLDALEQESA